LIIEFSSASIRKRIIQGKKWYKKEIKFDFLFFT
jgi:hypothetical protein